MRSYRPMTWWVRREDRLVQLRNLQKRIKRLTKYHSAFLNLAQFDKQYIYIFTMTAGDDLSLDGRAGGASCSSDDDNC
jgi:phage repressor protein C with HTH and peptisase S24 domain